MATAKNFATITTLLADGQPSTQVMWVDADDDCVLINTEAHRTKFGNVERDPRVTVVIWELGNPYRYAEVRGRVAEIVRGDGARAHIDQLAERYTGQRFDPDAIESERVLLRIAPERQRLYG